MPSSASCVYLANRRSGIETHVRDADDFPACILSDGSAWRMLTISDASALTCGSPSSALRRLECHGCAWEEAAVTYANRAEHDSQQHVLVCS